MRAEALAMTEYRDDIEFQQIVTRDYLNARLRAAGMVAVSIPEQLRPSQRRTAWPEVVRSIFEAYGWHAEQSRFPVPTAKAICDMYEVFDWILMLEGRDRKIVSARMLWHPLKDKPMVSWRRLGGVLHVNHETVKRWHDEALDRLVTRINATR